MHTYITNLRLSLCLFINIKRNVYFLSHIHFILLRHVTVIYGHHQVYVSPARTVSLYTLLCYTFIFYPIFFYYLFAEIMKNSLKAH
jgi:hypothetical protein